MSLNYVFLADQIDRFIGPQATVLDYGCGHGQLIAAAIERGHDAYGCDPGDPMWEKWAKQSEYKERIRPITRDQKIPFGDEKFDIVIANQVFEHIDNFEMPLSEIHRVLKPGGLFINCFPTLEAWWEGHQKTPLAQHFFSSADLWRKYLIVMHRLHLGKNRSGKTAQQWAHESRDLPSMCFYKPLRQVVGAFEKWFEVLQIGRASCRERV